jgi:hypothetical protein
MLGSEGALWQWVLTGLALLLGLWVAVEIYGLSNSQQEDVPTLRWLVAWLLLLVAWLRLPALSRMRAWLLAHRSEMLVLAGVTLVGALLRMWHLGGIPYALSGDEGSIGMDIGRTLAGEITNPFTLAWSGLPTLSFMLQAIPAWLLGLNPWTLRLVNAIFGVLAIPALYVLARLLFDRMTALAAAVLLAGYVFHLHYSRAAINVIFDTFFYPASLALLVYGLRRASGPGPFVLAGLCAGLTQYMNVGGRLLPIVIVAFLAYLWLFNRSWLRGQQDNLLLLLVTFLVITGPMIVLAINYPHEYNTRINQIGIIQNGWLEQEQTMRGSGALPILFEQFYHALLGFGVYPDRTESYGGGPLANPLMAVLLFLGLGLSIYRWRQPASALLLLWFFGGVLGGGMLTMYPPTSNRLVVLTPVVALLAALALVEVVRLLVRALGRPLLRRRALALACVLALPVAGLDVYHYFYNYLPRHIFGGGHAYIATTLGYDLGSRETPPHLYFFGPPRMWSGFSSLVFLAPDLQSTDIVEPVRTPEDVAQLVAGHTDTDALFVFLPENREQFDVVQRRFPRGSLVEIYHPDPERHYLMFMYYYVPSETLARSHLDALPVAGIEAPQR